MSVLRITINAILMLRAVLQLRGGSAGRGARPRPLPVLVAALMALYTVCDSFAGPASAAPATVAPAQDVSYPGYRVDHPFPISYLHPLEVLKLAVEKSRQPINLVPVVNGMSSDRRAADMREGKTFDVIWTVTSKALEADLIPIRICILKGLNGWRIPVVIRRNEDMLANVNTLADLQKLSMGSGFTWIDTEVLQTAGIRVERTHEVNGLYKMLGAGRFDLLPRGVQDVGAEVQLMKHLFGMDVVIDTHIVIRYPLPMYFFVRRDKPELAEALRQGLEAAIKDGSFDDLFYKFYGGALTSARLDERKIIQLTNPQLTPETPLARKNLWFSTDDLKRRAKK